MYTINKQKPARMIMDVDSSINRTVLDAFKSYATSRLTRIERIEEEIILPEGHTATLDNTIVTAAILGSLLSSEGRVNVGITTDESPTYIEIDTTKLHDINDVHAFIHNLRYNSEIPRLNGITLDIEVSNIKSNLSEESSIWLLAQNGRCTLSIKGDCIDSNMFAHLCKITTFAFEKALKDKKVIPAVDSLPTRPKYIQRQHKSMIEHIYNHKQKNPLSMAILDDVSGKILTYDELWKASESVIQQVREQINTQEAYPRIAIFIERSWKHLISVIATQRMGGTCVLIDLTNPDDRIRDFLNECSPDAIISAVNVIDRARSLTSYPVLDFDKGIYEHTQLKQENDEWIKTDNDVCFIAGTSGTTGRPKAACLSYSGMAATIDTIIDTAELGTNSRGSWLSSPGYGMIEVDPLPVLCAGGTVCIPSSDVLKDIKLLAHWFTKTNITNTLVMTSIAEALWANGFHSGLQTMLVAGERCKQWPKTEYRVLNVYGSAEAAVVSIEDLSEASRRTLLPSVGRAVPGVNMYVVDDDGRELPACCIGELIITGETLSKGYIDYKETQKSFRPNELDTTSKLQYSSGDRARMSLDGTVEIFGRSNALVKIRGHRVDLAEIEITALEVSGVAKAAALCFNDSAGEILELFIETAPNAENVKNEVRQYLSKKLHPAAQPSQIRTTKLPLGYNDKVDYAALRSNLVERDKVHTAFYPSTKNETALRECWLAWTRCDEITLESNFFQEGGDSLRAMRMLGDLTYKYGINIEMSPFLENPVFSNLLHLSTISQTIDMPKFENLPIDQQLEPFNLTEYQQALWIGRGSDFNYGDIGCQGYFEWEVEDLNRDRFARAVVMLVERHPMLRATIDDSGCQRIGTVDASQAVEFIDISDLSPNEIENEINKMRKRMANQEIGIAEWPLFRFVVSQISPQISRIHFNIDLLIADAWSIFQVIIPDIIDLYSKEETELPPIHTTFQDYVAYRNKVKHSAQYHSHREYWLEKIHKLPDAPKLPQLEQIETGAPVRFERFEGTLEKEKWELLKSQGQERKISPSGVVALVFCEALSSWSEKDQFTLNLPISDRMSINDDINFVVGDFTNPLLVPYEVAADDTLQTRGQLLQEAIWQALDHRLFTGVEVLRELSRLKRTGPKPLMPVVLTSLLGHQGRHDVSLLGREVFGTSQTPQVTLDVQVRESKGTLHFKWDYIVGVIRPDVIEEMFSSFCDLLNQLADEPGIWNQSLLDV
ncbi:AMP-binding protein [Fictibacillus sp. KIGAM418]|uniref:AMP-binding protein n=1 Tax=Fictibacillus marinisediminis TaxID=2878389 RepID=A0A9X1XE13_9BACL|nr:AMP-binding protein [Fictibacillus marinisediminis]MCK6258798.1 AMP-binding protein [Fictibacillus marinisediminis]